MDTTGNARIETHKTSPVVPLALALRVAEEWEAAEAVEAGKTHIDVVELVDKNGAAAEMAAYAFGAEPWDEDIAGWIP